MNTTSKTLSIVAYYLSEYNTDALDALGYRTYSEAFESLSAIFGRENSYLKLRRDEFDALPESNSARVGWKNRPPAKKVLEIASHLREFSFDEMTALVKELINNTTMPFSVEQLGANDKTVSPSAVEDAINSFDSSASIRIKVSETKIRVYNTSIILRLKTLYNFRCQICGCRIGESYGSQLIHAHHIDYFSRSLNNDAANILIVCPNHHGIIHDKNPEFNRETLTYHYPNGFVQGLKINMHL